MSKKKNIRKIRFGIRFKLSLIMIAGIAFASIIIGFALFTQNEKKVKDTMFRMSEVLLQGAIKPAEKYLANKNFIQSYKSKKITNRRRKKIFNDIRDSRREMAGYFSSLISIEKNKGVDRILDIPFLIEFNWKNLKLDWKKGKQAKYGYFNKTTGNLEATNGKDPLLEETILSYYMDNPDEKTHLIITDILHDEKLKKYDYLKEKYKKFGKDYIIVGMPVFNRKRDRLLYRYYHEFINNTDRARQFKILKNYDSTIVRKKEIKNESMTVEEYVSNNLENEKKFRDIFTTRLINHGMNLDYSFIIDSEKKKTLLYSFFLFNFKTTHIKKDKRIDLKDEFLNLKLKDNNSITIKDYKEILNSITKKYRIKLKAKIDRYDLWKNFYYFIKRNSIDIGTEHSLDKLALYSYRKDLTGVLGIFLWRGEFFNELERNRNEIIDLIISILIRCTIIALFFPTFLIHAISMLAKGADEFGKGNFDKKIQLTGSDELGRLADHLNKMTDDLVEKFRMENELKTAQGIQEVLLPDKLPEVKGLEFGAFYSACSESGGDYYDFIELENGLIGITVGDVSGHGVGSGLVMAMTRTLLHTYCNKTKNNKKIFEEINSYLHENTASNYFVTMFYGTFDPSDRKLKYVSAGHNQGIILHGSDKLELIPAGGIALGATSNSVFSGLVDNKVIELQKGDYFIQFTDGIDEAVNKNDEEFGLDRFYNALKNSFGKHPEEMVKSVIKTLTDFTGKIPQHDDITLIILKIA